MWKKLRANQLGAAVRRQHAIGPFIVDFCATDCGLVIELDGDSHGNDDAQQYDEQRTQYLQEQGWEVVRYWNNDVMNSLDAVVEDITKYLGMRPPLTPPSKLGGGRKHTQLNSH